jgi:hypothetical protein
MAGDRPQWLAPSILVWCYAEDTKARVRKHFEDEAWLKYGMHIHRMNHYILDKPPRRSAKPAFLHGQSLCILGGCSVIVPEHNSTSCGLTLVLESGEKCNIGGLIFVDGAPYLITTRHGLDGFLRSLRRRQGIIRFKSAGRRPSTCSEVPPSVSTDGDAPASDNSSYTPFTTPPSSQTSPEGRPEKLYRSATTRARNANHQVNILCPPIPADEDSVLECPADDFDWALVDLSDAPSALLEDILRPNMVHGKPIQGLHLGEIDDQRTVTVVTAGVEAQLGLLSSVSSTLQVDGSLHDVRLITLDKPLRE